MKKRNIILIVILVLFAGFTIYKLVSNKAKIEASKETTLDPDFKIPVNVSKVENAPIGGTIQKTVSLLPFREAKIMVSMPGQIVSWKANLGDSFVEGVVMGNIDVKQTQLQLESAELALSRLEKEYKRYSDLLSGGGIPEVNFDEVKFNYENTKIQVAQLKQKLADSYVRAPFQGVVTMKLIELGEFANPGQPLVFLTDISKLKVMARLSETEIASVKLGDKVQILIGDQGNKEVEGQITYIAPKADAAKNYEVEVVLQNADKKIKAGGFAVARFGNEANENVLQIRRSAIVESIKNPYVYVLENGLARRKDIKLGRQSSNNLEVLEGLTEGETIIVSGQINLKDSTAVEVIK